MLKNIELAMSYGYFLGEYMFSDCCDEIYDFCEKLQYIIDYFELNESDVYDSVDRLDNAKLKISFENGKITGILSHWTFANDIIIEDLNDAYDIESIIFETEDTEI